MKKRAKRVATEDRVPLVLDDETLNTLRRLPADAPLSMKQNPETPMDKFKAQDLCRSVGGIPSSMRVYVWPLLLGVDIMNRERLQKLAHDIDEVDGSSLKTYRIIEMDVDRTRQTIPFFRQKETKDLMKSMLALF
eukprot:g976.t1